MKISESKRELFTLRDACYAEIKPSPVKISIFKVRFTVTRDPEVKAIFCASTVCI